MDSYERLTEAFRRLGLDDTGAKAAARAGRQKTPAAAAATPNTTPRALTWADLHLRPVKQSGGAQVLRETDAAPRVVELREDTAQNWRGGVPR
jgi:hypothetical protein